MIATRLAVLDAESVAIQLDDGDWWIIDTITGDGEWLYLTTEELEDRDHKISKVTLH